MELIVIVVSSLSFLFFLYSAVAKLLNTRASSHPQIEIPGPKKLPLIGNLHLLGGESPPHHVLQKLAAKHGALMRLQLGQVPFIIVSSAEAAKQITRSHDITFSNRIPMITASIFSYDYNDLVAAPYGEHWRQLRKVCTLELLSSRRVRSFRSIREEEINFNLAKRIASCSAGSPANLSERLNLSSFAIVARSAVGDNIEERRAITSAIDEVMKLSSGFSVVDLYPRNRLLPLITGMSFRLARIFRRTDRILQSIVDRHRTDGGAVGRAEDLVDVLLEYQKNQSEFHLSTDTIKAVILDMFIAGTETSATVVEWAMSEMIRNPRTLKTAQEQVRQVFDDSKGYVDEAEFQELKYLKLVIKETLRLHPPLPLLIPRMSSQKCEINGYEIAAETRVIINSWALGRDPQHWNEAEKFKPERFVDGAIEYDGNNFQYLPFGSGRRSCPGQNFGMANAEFTLAMLLYHFDWEMPFGLKTEELDMTEAFGSTVKRKRHLLLIPTLRRPLLAAA